MITRVLTQDGRRISAEEAIRIRDRARKSGEEEPIFIDPQTGDTLIKPRKGHSTLLSHARAHFYHPSNVRERGIGTERREVISRLEEILQRQGFHDFRAGVVVFRDIESALRFDASVDFNYGFYVLSMQGDDKNYAVLVLNRVPNSRRYLNFLRYLNDTTTFEGKPRIRKVLVNEDGEETELGKVYLATIQVKNRHLYRPNMEEGHPQGYLMLGDWQIEHLSRLYPEFVYFDPSECLLENVRLEPVEHSCSYSFCRAEFKGGTNNFFCQLMRTEPLGNFSLEPHVIRKNELSSYIGNHPRLHLARFRSERQGRLFF